MSDPKLEKIVIEDKTLEQIEIPEVPESRDAFSDYEDYFKEIAGLIPEPRENIIDWDVEIEPTKKDELAAKAKQLLKTQDIYGNSQYETIVSAWGKKYFNMTMKAADNIYGKNDNIWRQIKREHRNHKIKRSKSRKDQIKENFKVLNQVMVELSEEWAKEKAKEWEQKIDKKTAKADEVANKLKDFSETKRKSIKKAVEEINNIASPDDLKKKIYEYFAKKIDSMEEPKFVKMIKEKMEPAKEIEAWYNDLTSIYEAASSLDLGSVVDVVKNLVLIQYYPFITKYRQYKAIIDDLRKTVIEMQLILDAIKNKAQQYGDEAGIVIPPLPPIPDLPELPDLPI